MGGSRENGFMPRRAALSLRNAVVHHCNRSVYRTTLDGTTLLPLAATTEAPDDYRDLVPVRGRECVQVGG
jgi:hypothetical protein